MQSRFTLQRSQVSGDLELVSNVNRRKFPIGRFSCPSLADLREEAISKLKEHQAHEGSEGRMGEVIVRHVAVQDALEIHASFPGCTVQAARWGVGICALKVLVNSTVCCSQFNCLEFPHPNTTPEEGITDYASDPTQGPACAIACAAGALYRNYFVEVDSSGQQGQRADRQINNLIELEDWLNNARNKFWLIRNGYSFSSEEALLRLNEVLSEVDISEAASKVRVGVHRNVGVVYEKRNNEVESQAILCTQVYCSALSCAYSGISNKKLWEPLATIVLKAAYEATLWAAILTSLTEDTVSASRTYSLYKDHVFLTAIGGGVFGNEQYWIEDAIVDAVQTIRCSGLGAKLTVSIAHYKKINAEYAERINRRLGIQ